MCGWADKRMGRPKAIRNDGDLIQGWFCQGKPRCELRGKKREAAQMAGCVWCVKITVLPDGEEHIEKPGEA